MIDFGLTDELELIRATARDFADDHLRPHSRDHEKARTLAPSLHRTFGEIGFATIDWPEALGGSGLGALARALVLEELAAGDVGATVALDTLGAASHALAELPSADDAAALARTLLDEPGSRALAVWNGAGGRAHLEIDARSTTDPVTGVIPWVPADRVDLLVILDENGARIVRDGISLSAIRGAGLRAAGASELRLDAAPVCAAFRDRDAAARVLARARLDSAAMLVGVMRESAEFSRQYALERTTFGKPIAHHQALAFLITDIATAVDSARMLVWDAAWRIDQGLDAREACATAYIEAIEQSMFVTPNGVQILGGHGFMQDYPVEKYMREARTLGLMWGGVDAARDDAARDLVDGQGRVALSVEATP